MVDGVSCPPEKCFIELDCGAHWSEKICANKELNFAIKITMHLKYYVYAKIFIFFPKM